MNGKTPHVLGLEDFVLLNVRTIQSDLQIYHNPYQIPITFFIEIEKYLKISMVTHTHTDTHTHHKKLKPSRWRHCNM